MKALENTLSNELNKRKKLHKDKSVAVDKCKDQIAVYEEEAEALRRKIEEGVVKLTQSHVKQKLVLTTIEGGGKEASASPAPADLLVGIESMQKAYNSFSVEQKVLACRRKRTTN